MDVETLKRLMIFNPETGEFFRTKANARGRGRPGQAAGCLNAQGYVRICLNYKDYYGHRLAWLYCFGELPEGQIDHINGDHSDNRIANLRLASNAENNQNRTLQRNNTSGYKGVSLHKQSGLWAALVTKNRKRFSGGYHATPEEAYLAASRLRESLHGDYAQHNDRAQPCGS